MWAMHLQWTIFFDVLIKKEDEIGNYNHKRDTIIEFFTDSSKFAAPFPNCYYFYNRL